jgi:hypothetical protein
MKRLLKGAAIPAVAAGFFACADSATEMLDPVADAGAAGASGEEGGGGVCEPPQ